MRFKPKIGLGGGGDGTNTRNLQHGGLQPGGLQQGAASMMLSHENFGGQMPNGSIEDDSRTKR